VGDWSVGLQQVLRKHKLRLDEGSHILCDTFCASHVYGNVHMQGDVEGGVTQVPHAELIADVFGAEGDVAGLLQFFAQLQVDRIRCIRQVAASLQTLTRAARRQTHRMGSHWKERVGPEQAFCSAQASSRQSGT